MNGNKLRQFYLMVICVIVLGMAAGVGFFTVQYEKQTRTMVSMRQKSYYELMDGVENVTEKLYKVEITEGRTQQYSLLSEVQTSAEIAGINLAQLSTEEQRTEDLVAFLNKISDYAKALSKKVGSGNVLSEEEKTKLIELAKITEKLFDELNRGIDRLYEAKLPNGVDLSTLAGDFTKKTIDYPELIYDGPFSDALKDKNCKFLNGKNEITGAEGEDILRNLLKDYEISGVAFIEESGADIPAFTYSLQLGKAKGTAQLTKQGGILSMLSLSADTNESGSGEKELAACAVDFARAAGFGTLEVVWKESINGVTYFNLTPVENGIIFYPDLVMVKIREDNCKVVGMESKNYILNHVKRKTLNFSITPQAALESVSKLIVPINVKRALIPTDWGTEIAAYEIHCHAKGKEYFVYVDAVSGEEANVLMVVGQRLI